MKALDDEMRRIAEENYRLLYSFMYKKGINLDEFFGDYAIAYCQAIATYDKTKGELSTYVFAVLENQLKTIYRRKMQAKTIPEDAIISLNKPTYDESSSLADCIVDPAVNIESEIILRQAVERIKSEFTPEELSLLHHIIYRKSTNSEIAKKLSISKSTLSRKLSAVESKAKRFLLGHGERGG